jgi:hypothetical protein
MALEVLGDLLLGGSSKENSNPHAVASCTEQQGLQWAPLAYSMYDDLC